MPPAVTIFKDRDDLAMHAADLITRAAQGAIRVRGRAMLALAGGSTLAMTYSVLAQPARRSRVDWAHTHLFFGDERFVRVNDYLQTSNRRIYTVGDVALARKFTHVADASARIVIQNALFWGRKKLCAQTIPWCTYTDPEIAHVGVYVKECREQGFPLKTFTVPMSDVDRAVLDGETEGFVKIHVHEGTDTIVGATIVARHAGEMINEISLAMVAGIGLKTVSQVIHSYPTQAEAIRQAGDAYIRTRLSPFVRALSRRWLAWSR